MTFRLRLPLPVSLLALATALAASLSAQAGTPSLFNPSDAKKLTKEQQALLGPQSKNFRYDKRMLNALQIAQDRAHAHSTSRCWRYVKTALVASNTIDTYPKSANAKEAGTELEQSYGFKRLRVSDPYKAPVGSVLVYGGDGAGHVEIRTASGFVSDFTSERPSRRPLIGVYVKPRA